MNTVAIVVDAFSFVVDMDAVVVVVNAIAVDAEILCHCY